MSMQCTYVYENLFLPVRIDSEMILVFDIKSPYYPPLDKTLLLLMLFILKISLFQVNVLS